MTSSKGGPPEGVGVVALLGAAALLFWGGVAKPTPTAQAQPVWQVVTIPGLPAGATLSGIWDSAPNDVYVSAHIPTDVPQGFVFHWDGTSWSQVLSLPGHSMGKVFGTGPSDVYALTYKCTAGSAAGCGADRGGRIFRSTDGGATWAPQALPAEVGVNGLADISGTPGNVHVIVGGDAAGNHRIIRFDGTNWSIVFTGNSDATGKPNGLTLLSANEGYFVTCWGWGRWNGVSWTFNGIQFDFCDIASVWGVRDGGGALHMYTVGNNNFSNGVRVWKFNEASQSFGSKFGYVFADGCCAFNGSAGGVWGSGPNDVYVVGNLPGVEPAHPGRLYHFDGTAWARVTAIGDIPGPAGIWGTGPNDVWVLLSDGRLLHFAELDNTAPTIALTTPADGAVYTLGQLVFADYACADEAGGSGLASCVGDVADGAAIDTGTPPRSPTTTASSTTTAASSARWITRRC